MNKWLSTGYLTSKPSGRIDSEQGIIEGVKVCTEGPAAGHGVHLDGSFIDEVIRQGNEKKQGLKARFGHPNMCSTALGTFLGRHKNFRKETTTRDDGSTACTAVADLFLSNEAKNTPNGDLYAYVMGLAENEPDMFGESIVFSPGDAYRKTDDGRKVKRQYEDATDTKAFDWVTGAGDKVDSTKVIDRDYIECEALHACDVVDDPAANDGLFSRFAQETVAGQITEFLDLHPQVWQVLDDNPQVLEALARYGNNADQFFQRYAEYRTSNNKENAMKKESASIPLEAVAVVEVEEVEVNAEVAEPTDAPDTAEPEPETPLETVATTIDAQSFGELVEEFGAEIAAEVVLKGGSKADAYKAKADKLEARVRELEAARGGQAAKPSMAGSGKKSIWG